MFILCLFNLFIYFNSSHDIQVLLTEKLKKGFYKVHEVTLGLNVRKQKVFFINIRSVINVQSQYQNSAIAIYNKTV